MIRHSQVHNMKPEAHMCLDRSVESQALFPSEHYPPLLWKVLNLFLYQIFNRTMMLIHCTKLTCIYELLFSQVVTTLQF
jgi:hypothetical protein